MTFKHLSPKRTIKISQPPPSPSGVAAVFQMTFDTVGNSPPNYYDAGPISYLGFYDPSGNLNYIWFNYYGGQFDETGLVGYGVGIYIEDDFTGAAIGAAVHAEFLPSGWLVELDIGTGTLTFTSANTGPTNAPISLFDVVPTPGAAITTITPGS